MSRIKVDALEPHHDVFVGWDSPLETYFGQVYDMTILDEDAQLIHWIGLQVGEIFDLSGLVEVMKPYCTISDEIRAQLLRDYNNKTEPTSLQKHFRHLAGE